MLKEEFEKFTGMEVSEENYRNIELIYEGLPEYMNKVYLADAINGDSNKCINILSYAGACIRALIEEREAKRKIMESCAYDLIRKAHAEDDPISRNMAALLIGEEDVVFYTITNGLPLREEDRKFLTELMQRRGE